MTGIMPDSVECSCASPSAPSADDTSANIASRASMRSTIVASAVIDISFTSFLGLGGLPNCDSTVYYRGVQHSVFVIDSRECRLSKEGFAIKNQQRLAYTKIATMADLVPPMAIRAGVTLGIFDALHESPANAESISEMVGSSHPNIQVLLSMLEELQLLTRDKNNLYELSEVGVYLTSRNASFAKAFDLDSAIGLYEYSIVDLVEVLRKQRSYFANRFGKDYWQLVDASPSDSRLVAEFSSPTATFDSESLVEDDIWSTATNVVDLGGGNGNMLIALATHHPQLRGIVMDLPRRVESAISLIEDRGLSDRLEAVGGDFFKYIPPGYDHYLLNAILADWSDDECVSLLKSVHKALGRSANLVISEVDLAASFGTASVHLKMICAADGCIRTPQEVEQLAQKADLKLVRSSHATTRFTHVYQSA